MTKKKPELLVQAFFRFALTKNTYRCIMLTEVNKKGENYDIKSIGRIFKNYVYIKKAK